MVFLFALCIIAPGTLFGYLSLRQVEMKFHQETIHRMRIQSREVAMAIHGGFTSVEIQVNFLASMFRNGTFPPTRPLPDQGWMFQKGPLLGATLFREGSRPESWFGNPFPPPLLSNAGRNHLASGKSLLYFRPDPGGIPRFFLAGAIPGKGPEHELLACEVNPDHFWGRVQDAIPPASEVAVLSSDGAVLFQTHPFPPQVLGRVAREGTKEPAGNFESDEGSDALLVAHAAVFLKPAFFSEDWTVVVTQPRSVAFAAARNFTRVLLLTVLLLMLVVALFFHVQIRKSIRPLSVLEEGTRRISEGDFDSRIAIRSGDEFEELAHSFNAMAGKLGEEFRVQADMGRIVQAILNETTREKIVAAVLGNVNAVVPCDCAGLALMDYGVARNLALTYVREDLSAVPPVTGRTMLTVTMDETQRLISAKDTVLQVQGAEFDHFLSRWKGERPAAFLFCPFLSGEALAGVLLVGYRIPPAPPPEHLIRLRQVADQVAIALGRAQLLRELVQNDLGTLQALARAVDTNSPWTGGHSERVTALATEIGRELGLPQAEIDLLHRGGLLHDIGKLGVSPAILEKPGKLTEEEFAVLRQHPSKGAKILDSIPGLQKVIPLVAQHHERFDGKGYPRGLPGKSITLHARILAVADVVDALVSERPYRTAWPREKVLSYARENSGLHFDPAIVEAFLRIESRRGRGATPDASEAPEPEVPNAPLPPDGIHAGIST